MFRLQFNQVFVGLMVLSALTAFVAPRHISDLGGARFEAIFFPISRPSYHLANALRGRFAPGTPEDSRPSETLAQENLILKSQVLDLQGKVERLQQLAGERQSLGDLKSLCDRFSVSAAAENRDVLLIAGTLLGRLRIDQPVISVGNPVVNLVGKVMEPNALGARIRLITDAGNIVTGRFVTFSSDAGQQVNKDLLAIVRGTGRGEMNISNIAHQDLERAHVTVGDWVVLNDETFPAAMQGVRIGRIASIEPSARQNQFSDIRLVPETELMHQSDVWVMTRQP